jgi:hypothetical protein
MVLVLMVLVMILLLERYGFKNMVYVGASCICCRVCSCGSCCYWWCTDNVGPVDDVGIVGRAVGLDGDVVV